MGGDGRQGVVEVGEKVRAPKPNVVHTATHPRGVVPAGHAQDRQGGEMRRLEPVRLQSNGTSVKYNQILINCSVGPFKVHVRQ